MRHVLTFFLRAIAYVVLWLFSFARGLKIECLLSGLLKGIWKSAADARSKSLNQYVIDLIHTDNPDLFPAEDN